jgi:hypothetical protein
MHAIAAPFTRTLRVEFALGTRSVHPPVFAIGRLVLNDAPMRARFGVSTVMTAIGAAGLAGSALWVTTPPAAAAFPGANGDIAFVSTRNNNVAIYQVNP